MLYSILHRLSKQLLLAFILVLPFSVNAAISDIQFGQYQIADSQWNVSACLYTTTCEIYSKQPGTAYKIPWYNGQVQWAAGDYVKLELSGDPNYPYVARQYSSTGVLKETLGTGKIVNMGPDYFFFVGNDDNTGQLFSGSSGMSDTSGVTWTGTLNPTIAEADAYADANYSTTPLAPGQTAQPSAPPPPPTPVYGPSGPTQAQHSQRGNALNQNPLGHNAVVGITGDDNIVTIQQIGSGGHYASVDIQGNVNTVSVNQTGANGSRHYLDTSVIGNNNSLTLTQSGANKTQFVSVNGSNNTLTATQTGAGSHFLNLGVSGDNHTVGIVQDGASNHSANVVLDGSQPWNFQLNQNSSTNQNYTLPHGMSDGSTVSGSCAAIGGCNLIVNQQ
jgi:hypothetical protein